MNGTSRTMQWKSCPRGHNYLGDRCPCEQANRYTAKYQQAFEGSPSTPTAEIGEGPERQTRNNPEGE